MGRLIASVSLTFDGILSGPKGDEDNMISWAMPGVQDLLADNLAMFQQAAAILMGRVTYEGFASYWPYQAGDWADAMNQTKKYVAARRLNAVQWGSYPDSVELINRNVAARVKKLKQEVSGDIVIPASSKLVRSLLNAGLIDEFHTVVHPVILGSGKRYLSGIKARTDLSVLYTKFYERSGSMLYRYRVAKAPSAPGTTPSP